jgi:flagellar biosynthesis/type III secretory pathway chaperone
MQPELDRYVNLLERRLDSLRQLAVQLKETQHAYTAMDLNRITQYINQQENLCNEIRSFDDQIRELSKSLSAALNLELDLAAPEVLMSHLDESSQRKLKVVTQGLANIQADVRRLNRVQAELLKRSKRTVNMLINMMAQYTCRFELRPVLVPAGMTLEIKE